MIASTTSGGGCRGGWTSRFVNLGMVVLAHVMLPGSRHGCPRRAADAFCVLLQGLLFAQLDVVIFARSNLHTHKVCVDNLPASRRPRSTRPATTGGLAVYPLYDRSYD